MEPAKNLIKIINIKKNIMYLSKTCFFTLLINKDNNCITASYRELKQNTWKSKKEDALL